MPCAPTLPSELAVHAGFVAARVDEAWRHLRACAVSAAFEWLDSLQDVEGSLGWASALGGAFEPVAPARHVPLHVKSGQIPRDIAGTFMRIGPNAAQWPPKHATHVFDGDGMVHTVRLSGGEAVYNCAFMETPRFNLERQGGHFLRIAEMAGPSGLAKLLLASATDNRFAEFPEHLATTANTSLAFTPEGKLWAMHEAGVPFRFELDGSGCPRSVGFDTHAGTLAEAMSAHPKFDRRTGETFFHGSIKREPARFYVGRAAGGRVTDRVELPLHAGFHHDIVVTERYVVVVDGSMSWEPESLVQAGALWKFAPERKLRFGVWPRSAGTMAAEDFVWIESSEAAEIIHALHASDAGDAGYTIVVWAPVCRHQLGASDSVLGDIGPPRMSRIEIDVAAGSVEIASVPGSELRTEFPRVREDAIGCSALEHGYSAIQAEGDGNIASNFNFIGLAKWNFQAGGLDRAINFPPGIIGGEPIFIPSAGSSGLDDRGYIGTFLWDTRTRESSFALFDAQTMAPEPVVELEVPSRVPMGFHGLWVGESELRESGVAAGRA